MKLKHIYMKRLFNFIALGLASTLVLSCLNADTKKNFSKNPNHVTSDELLYGIESADVKTTSQLITTDITENSKRSRLNNSTFQEMLVVYSHLVMSEHQILVFEDQFNTKVKESSENLPTQIEIQDIMDVSFETVLTEDQFNMYNDWRIVGTQ